MRRTLLLGCVLGLALSGTAFGQESEEKPEADETPTSNEAEPSEVSSPEPASAPVPEKAVSKLDPVWEGAAVGAVERGPVWVSQRVKDRPKLGHRPTTGLLSKTRALSTKDHEARLLVEGAERTVRTGDRFGTDLVKSISEGRMVLLRPAEVNPKVGECLVIVEFDEEGQPNQIVISKIATLSEPPKPQ